eukprot:3713230-Amphidinium_carterae.1
MTTLEGTDVADVTLRATYPTHASCDAWLGDFVAVRVRESPDALRVSVTYAGVAGLGGYVFLTQRPSLP